MSADFVGFKRAQELVSAGVRPLSPRRLALDELGGLVLAEELYSQVASPSVTCSKKDGYALRAADVAGAGPQAPVRLSIAGGVTAGESPGFALGPGQAARITTGAALPPGADAVVPEELVAGEDGAIRCPVPARPGDEVLPQGSDLAVGEAVAAPGERLTPGLVGLLAAAGHDRALCHPLPRVALLASGNELALPGGSLPDGGVYASNLATLAAWLASHGLPVRTMVCPDSRAAIREAAAGLLEDCDALLTSGGAWLSERDLVVGALSDLGMELGFRRVRIGPGKGVAFGLINEKPLFCLPGSPLSNQMAFLQLALPAILTLAGHRRPGLPFLSARLAGEMGGQADWTQLWYGALETGPDGALFKPLGRISHLKAIARAQAIFALPEGVEHLPAGAEVTVQRLGLAFDRDGAGPATAELHN